MLNFFKIVSIFCLFNFLLPKEVKQTVFQYKKLKGIVFLEYEKQGNRFWLKSQEFITKNQKYYLLYSRYGDVLAKSDLLCEHGYIPPSITQKSLFDIPLFQSQIDSLKEDFFKHHGGNIYEKDKNTLVIAFYLISDVLIINKEICEGYFLQSNYSCPVNRQKMYYPCIVVTKPKKYKVINKKSIKRYHLSKTEITKFDVGFCD